jgi:hypothetical protein
LFLGMDAPSPAELLRAALEKIVFFEWRLKELAAELSAAQSRCASAETERARAVDEARTARMQLADLEADRSRLAALLSQPREDVSTLQSELHDARQKLAANKAERERWLNEMIDQAKNGDEAPAALAQFISELRNEVILLRDRLQQNGLAAPVVSPAPPVAPADPIERAQKMWDEGRLAAPVKTTHFAVPPPGGSIASRALTDQCLRGLESPDSSRREQAAKHLVSLPMSAATPVLVDALNQERDHKARAQIARALIACGGENAAALVANLQADEHALVRLAALEALCSLPGQVRAAIERASKDAVAAVRRRAAALAVPEGLEEIFAADDSVRPVIEAAQQEAPVQPRAAARAALHVLSQGGVR